MRKLGISAFRILPCLQRSALGWRLFRQLIQGHTRCIHEIRHPACLYKFFKSGINLILTYTSLRIWYRLACPLYDRVRNPLSYVDDQSIYGTCSFADACHCRSRFPACRLGSARGLRVQIDYFGTSLDLRTRMSEVTVVLFHSVFIDHSTWRRDLVQYYSRRVRVRCSLESLQVRLVVAARISIDVSDFNSNELTSEDSEHKDTYNLQIICSLFFPGRSHCFPLCTHRIASKDIMMYLILLPSLTFSFAGMITHPQACIIRSSQIRPDNLMGPTGARRRYHYATIRL